MDKVPNIEEFRWIVVKSMLENYPALREKVKDYLVAPSTRQA